MMKVWHDQNSKTIAELMMCNWDWEGGSGSWNKSSTEVPGDLPLTCQGLATGLKREVLMAHF